jgi:hypothetical protein
MKPYIKIIIVIITLITVPFLYWTISPFFTKVVVSENLPIIYTNASSSLQTLAKGSFAGFDKIHNGTGTVSIYEIEGKKILRFEEGFKVNNGPDLYVGFGKLGSYVEGSEISKLKGTQGSQNYDIPQDFSLEQYDSVFVWCKAFNTPFIKAELSR